MNTTSYRWQEIESAPNKFGIYAWYYRLAIPKKDIDDLVSFIELKKSENIVHEAKCKLSEFIIARVYKVFENLPYDVSLSGKLLPAFSGKLSQNLYVSDTLIDRLLMCPSEISQLFEILEQTFPKFFGPIYIGKADRQTLKNRLIEHKKCILSLRQQYNSYGKPELDESAMFAEEVVKRKLNPFNLFVEVLVVENPTLALNLENMLNRINFPIMGRN